MVFKIDIYFKFECTLKIVRTIILKIVLSWKEQSFILNIIASKTGTQIDFLVPDLRMNI